MSISVRFVCCFSIFTACCLSACGSTPAVSSSGSDTSSADVSTDSGSSDVSTAVTCATAVSGTVCDDADPCTENEKCDGNKCVGTPVSCADDVSCTTDSCVKGKGCVHTISGCLIDGICLSAGDINPSDLCMTCQPSVNSGAYTADIKLNCDDGNECTQFDSCHQDGSCIGSQISCDDAKPCSLDACVKGSGCSHTDADSGPCDDGSQCTVGDTCKGGKCTAGTGVLDCDDKNPCSKDTCGAKTGCSSVTDPKACDDKDGCTVDACDPVKGCSHVPMKAGDKCTNGDLCVAGETCSQGLKCGGGAPVQCDDKNICTQDFCKPDKGCIHAINTLSCDDGEFCTYPDVCTGGSCIGVKTNSCKECTKIFSDYDAKLKQFQIGTTGFPGDGINVDGDKTTCAPEGNCSDGIDNAAAALAFIVNQPLSDSIVNGQFTFVAELAGYQGENIPFTLNLYYAEMDPSSKLAACDGQKDVCNWLVTQSAFNAACGPKFSFKDAMITGGILTAGGSDTLFAMDANIFGAKNATLYVKGARIEAKVTFDATTKAITGISGALGGAVPSPVVVDIINAMNDSVFTSIGGKANALDLVKNILAVDIDSDGDGVMDASSIGLRFAAIGAKIVGTSGK